MVGGGGLNFGYLPRKVSCMIIVTKETSVVIDIIDMTPLTLISCPYQNPIRPVIISYLQTEMGLLLNEAD